MKSDNYTYLIHNNLYLNLTNQCTNQCEFCIRYYADGLAGYRLVLNKEPDFEEVKKSISPHLESVKEVVFCGFGEPTYRINLIVQICKWLRTVFQGTIRLNTNGHGNLIHGRDILVDMEGLLDQINISLNASNAQEYMDICRPVYGLEAYPAIVDFIKKAKTVFSQVTVSAVTSSGVEMDRIEEMAYDLNVDFIIR